MRLTSSIGHITNLPRMKRTLIQLICLSMLTAAFSTHAQTASEQIKRQSFQTLTDYMAALGYNDVDIKIAHVDPRIRYAACSKPLDISMPNSSELKQKVMLSVTCDDEPSWQHHVSAKIMIRAPVVVAIRPLRRGEAITPELIRIEPRNLTTLYYGYFSELESVLGSITQRPIPAGGIILPGQIKPPLVVRKGQEVSVESGSTQLIIRTTAIALNNGHAGERVKLRNKSSGQIFEAIIESDGIARVRR